MFVHYYATMVFSVHKQRCKNDIMHCIYFKHNVMNITIYFKHSVIGVFGNSSTYSATIIDLASIVIVSQNKFVLHLTRYFAEDPKRFE